MSTTRKTTIRDVAARAGVARSSVSRVLSGHRYVSEALRHRVEAAVRELEYQPDFLGHSLRRGSTRSIGFLVGTIANPIIASIFASASAAVASHGYAMTLVSSQNNPELDLSYLRFLQRRQVDGLFVSSAANGPDQAASLIAELGIPAVMLDRDLPAGRHVSAVQSDHPAGMRAAVAHLIQQRHQRIGLIGGLESFYPARQRLQGFYSALRDAGITADPALTRSVGMNESVGYVETLAMLSLEPRPTALIAGSNLILVGMLRALRERGVMVGEDVALVGCDDYYLPSLHNPPITVVARDLTLFGETAARLLVEAMGQQQGRVITLPTWLVVRESSMRSL